MGARRGAELLSQRDLSHEAPGTAEHSETLTRIMKSQEDADVKAGVAAADSTRGYKVALCRSK